MSGGALLVAGTTSDAGKTLLTAGLCRALAREGMRVAPFKAQNMALNSGVTADGAEIGRAQIMQAAAAGVEPEAAMNPVLLKPGGERHSQLIVLGRPVAEVGALDYRAHTPRLAGVVADCLADLRGRFDAVICEGAGSPAEINLRSSDIVNMGLARAANLPVIVVGDIDRGGVFAALFGTLALLGPDDQALVAGFVINKFRGDERLLAPGLDQLTALTGRPVLGVLPWRAGLWLDAEDSLDLLSFPSPRADAEREPLRVAVIRLPRISNVTDIDALRAEPGVAVTLATGPAEIAAADLVVLPGTRSTVADLAWLRRRGLDVALARRAAAGGPILGVCGGYQMLGGTIDDPVESRAGRVDGLGLLPVTTTFAADKLLGRRAGTSPHGHPLTGYEIRHGRVRVEGGEPFAADGCQVGPVMGTSWHGLCENDAFRSWLLADAAARTGRAFAPSGVVFADVRAARLDALGDLVADHLDLAAIHSLLAGGAPPGQPTVRSALIPPVVPAPVPSPAAVPPGAPE